MNMGRLLVLGLNYTFCKNGQVMQNAVELEHKNAHLRALEAP